MYVYGASLFYVCCDCVGVCGNVCCVAAVVKDSVFSPWSVEACLCKGCDRCCICLFVL